MPACRLGSDGNRRCPPKTVGHLAAAARRWKSARYGPLSPVAVQSTAWHWHRQKVVPPQFIEVLKSRHVSVLSASSAYHGGQRGKIIDDQIDRRVGNRVGWTSIAP